MNVNLDQLPQPPNNKIGFPWTEGTPPQYFDQNLPKITIITPSYNQGQYIEETIRSVLLQCYPNLEYIIVDGGSTDNTVEIIKKYEQWITYWVSENDKGQSDAINKGLKRATGEVFNWLNSDDYYLPNALLTVGKAFKDNKETEVYCGIEKHLSDDGYEFLTEGTAIYDTLERTLAMGLNNQPPTFFKLDIVKKLGCLDSSLYFCMDADLWVNYLANYGQKNVLKSDCIINVFRIHPQAKSSKDRIMYYKDKFNIQLSLAKSIRKTSFPLHLIDKNRLVNPDFNRIYNLQVDLNQKQLLAFIVERFLHNHAEFLGWMPFIRLYVFAIFQLSYEGDMRFYLSPLIKLKRIFFPIVSNSNFLNFKE
jgi:glycosyltransferase involved in cell wall biosynthesis